ncbi:Uncharacterised protein [Nocardia farcinica]|uniref:Uncharacterized protein n=1 Tax=Nocardia farcinica TaxID=37329 RepID=A0A449H596_NOCFR|nr:hypothetical protein [Nocardia farcinica]VFA93202.1 Uncharacterised protein [Nocardia farcinica]
MADQDIPGAAALPSTPTRRAAGRLQEVLPPGYRVQVADLPVDLLGDRREPVIRVLVAPERRE